MREIPVAEYYKKETFLYKNSVFKDEIEWIRENIPELSLWSDLQITEMGHEDYGESQERRTFQTPLRIEMFLDYATYISVFNLSPHDVDYYACEEEIEGIYKAFANNENLDKWKKIEK